MTSHSLSEQLLALAKHMDAVSHSMGLYAYKIGPSELSQEIIAHSDELAGAAQMCQEWARGIGGEDDGSVAMQQFVESEFAKWREKLGV